MSRQANSRTGRLKLFIVFIVHCSLFILLAACARPDGTWERIREVGVLRVGMDASFPPFEYVAADGTLAGFDVDLARELGRRLGVEIEFVANLPFDGLYDALEVSRVDVVISALVVNPDRMSDFGYSAHYFDAGQVLVLSPSVPLTGGEGGGREAIEEMADLDGRTLAVEFGTQGDMEARKWARRLPDLMVTHYETAAEALAAVADGEADAALVDHVSALEGNGLTIVEQSVVEELYAVGVHRRSRYLLRAINDVLAGMEDDGTLDALVAEWLEGE